MKNLTVKDFLNKVEYLKKLGYDVENMLLVVTDASFGDYDYGNEDPVVDIQPLDKFQIALSYYY